MCKAAVSTEKVCSLVILHLFCFDFFFSDFKRIKDFIVEKEIEIDG